MMTLSWLKHGTKTGIGITGAVAKNGLKDNLAILASNTDINPEIDFSTWPDDIQTVAEGKLSGLLSAEDARRFAKRTTGIRLVESYIKDRFQTIDVEIAPPFVTNWLAPYLAKAMADADVDSYETPASIESLLRPSRFVRKLFELDDAEMSCLMDSIIWEAHGLIEWEAAITIHFGICWGNNKGALDPKLIYNRSALDACNVAFEAKYRKEIMNGSAYAEWLQAQLSMFSRTKGHPNLGMARQLFGQIM